MIELGPVLPRITALIRLFSSNNDGEALGAVRALGRTLESQGGSFHDLADRLEHQPVPVIIYRDAPRPAPQQPVPPIWEDLDWSNRLPWLDAALASRSLSAWERQFTASLRTQVASQPYRPLTAKQCAAINGVLATAWIGGVRL